MADIKKIIGLISDEGAKWLRVNDQPCMHTFIGNLYINLCLWKLDNQNVISIDVDDVKKGISDILAKDVKEGDDYYTDLFEIYSSSKNNAENIAFQN